MRSLRTSIILAGLAALLLGFILWFERGSLTSGELEKRKSSAIPELVRERVSRLEIQRAGTTTVLQRQSHDDDGDAPENWRVEAPYRATADQDAIDTLLGELEFLDARRRFENISADDRKRFGFEKPRYRLWFTVGDRRRSILVGNESPRGDGVYVQAADPKLAFVASKDLLQTLAQEPAHYHTKELHTGATIFGALELGLTDAQGERAVRKQADGSWTLLRPALGLASEPAISEVIQAFDGLRAKHFIEANAKSLGDYGLDKPRFELSLRAAGAGGAPAKPAADPNGPVIRLRVGSACPAHSGESYVTIDGHEISCALDEDLAKLGKPLAALREARMLPFDDDAIASLQLDRGDRRLQLTKTDAGWSYAALRAGKSLGQGDARPEAVADWLAALRDVKAAEWRSGALGPLRAADAITLGVARKDKPRYELRIDPSKRPLVAQRGTEPELALFSDSILDRLTPSAASFQRLDLIHVAPTAFRKFEIRRQNQVERLVSVDGKSFRIDAPIQADADTVRASELTRLIGALEVARFVADEPDPSHALTNPHVVLTAEYEGDDPKSPPKQICLRIGGSTDGGRFAQVDGQPGVFVLASRLADLLSEPFVSRTALAVPLEAIAAIDIEHAGKKLHLERQGDQIVATDPSVPRARGQAIAEAIATLRASSVISYGPSTAAQGLQKPYAQISITPNAPQARRTIALGNESQGGRYAGSDDSPVVFTLPANLMTTLLSEISGPKAGRAAHP